ncbi:hypothetical protein SHELI_v1c04250 [Spiroplasma helicoides]|uniref:Uncharacterized protein n=1 Tax=Spiroplasma helicoides TaxID=216938 RepID=A0A1B3SKB9_9MOLU|nr:hypothetical protein SHELI_v1c04250 [Spiroplasma helicoides]
MNCKSPEFILFIVFLVISLFFISKHLLSLLAATAKK